MRGQYRSYELGADPDLTESFTGKVQGQAQGYVRPVGACLAGDPVTYMQTGRVACSEPHIWEVVGDVDAGQAFTTPPAADSDAWNDKLRPACMTAAKAAFGGRITEGCRTLTSSSIDVASWRTGLRARRPATPPDTTLTNHPVILTAPLLPAALKNGLKTGGMRRYAPIREQGGDRAQRHHPAVPRAAHRPVAGGAGPGT